MSGILIATLLATVSAKIPPDFPAVICFILIAAAPGSLSSDMWRVGWTSGTGTSIWPAVFSPKSFLRRKQW